MISKKSDIKECRCNFCNTEFFYTENELIDVNEKYIGLICPQCGNQIEICKINNTKFPKDFYYFGDGKNISDNEIQEYIDKITENLKRSKDDFDYSYIACGDTIVFGIKFLDNDTQIISIYVSKNYYEYDIYLN